MPGTLPAILGVLHMLQQILMGVLHMLQQILMGVLHMLQQLKIFYADTTRPLARLTNFKFFFFFVNFQLVTFVAVLSCFTIKMFYYGNY